MNHKKIIGVSLSLLLVAGLTQAQQIEPAEQKKTTVVRQQAATVQVDISTTISGNQEQPRTLYVLPWQDSIAQIRIPAPEINAVPEPLKPLDRQQFLRFIEAQSLNQQPAATASSKNN